MAMPPPPPPGQGPTPPPPPPPGTPGPGAGGWGTAPPPPPGSTATTAPPGYASYGAAPHSPVGGERAGFGVRLGGYLLDALLYGLLGLVFLIPAIAMGVSSFADCEVVDNAVGSEIVCPDGAPDAGLLVGAVLLALVGYLLVAFIYVRALGKTGQTWGRRIVGIRVVAEADGEPLGFGRALGRSLFAVFISAQIVYLGYLWMLWDDKQQTWHDKVVSSVVVRA